MLPCVSGLWEVMTKLLTGRENRVRVREVMNCDLCWPGNTGIYISGDVQWAVGDWGLETWRGGKARATDGICELSTSNELAIFMAGIA